MKSIFEKNLINKKDEIVNEIDSIINELSNLKPDYFEKKKIIKSILEKMGKILNVKSVQYSEYRLVPYFGAELEDIEDGVFLNYKRFINLIKNVDPDLKNFDKLNKHPIFYSQFITSWESTDSIFYQSVENYELNKGYFFQTRGPIWYIVRNEKSICICKDKRYMEEIFEEDTRIAKFDNLGEFVEEYKNKFIKYLDEKLKEDKKVNSDKFWREYCAISVPVLANDGEEKVILGFVIFADIPDWDYSPISEDAMNVLENIVSKISSIVSYSYAIHRLNKLYKKLEETLNELKAAQEIIIEYGKIEKLIEFSEQMNHQINTLLLGILNALPELKNVNKLYNEILNKIYSLGLLYEDYLIYKEIENYIIENIENIKTLTGIDFIKIKRNYENLLLKYDIKNDQILDIFTRIQLPEEQSISLINLYKKYGEPVLKGIFYIFQNEKIHQTMKIAALKISELTSALKDYTYGEEVSNYDVRKGIESTLLILEVKLGGINIHKNYTNQELPTITCYPRDLDQVWTNIINNAIEAGAKNIYIDVYIKNENFIAVKIENDGPEIPKEIIDKIFDKHFTTKEKGTGIGLSMVKDIIENKHKGKINVFSSPEKTYFEILLLYNK